MFIAALCGAAAWMAEVTIVRRVQPPSQPPPAGGRSRVTSPGGGGSGRGPSPSLQPIAARAGGRGNRVSPVPRPREGLVLTQGEGETGFPHPPTRGRVWEGAALTQECGETRFPHAPAPGKVRAQPLRRGRGKPGFPTPPPAGGPGSHAGVWGNRVSPRPRPAGDRGNRVSPRPRPAGDWGNRVSPDPHPVGGSGRAQPSQEGCSSRRRAARAAWMAGIIQPRIRGGQQQ